MHPGLTRAGIVLNLVGMVLVTSTVYLLGVVVPGIEPGVVPAWGTTH